MKKLLTYTSALIQSLDNDPEVQKFELEDVDHDNVKTLVYMSDDVALCLDIYDNGRVRVKTIYPKKELTTVQTKRVKYMQNQGAKIQHPARTKWHDLIKEYDLLFDTYTDYPGFVKLVEHLIEVS